MRTQNWLQPLRRRSLALTPVVNGPSRGIIQPPLNVQRRPLQNEVLPGHEGTLKEKCGFRKIILDRSADSAYGEAMTTKERKPATFTTLPFSEEFISSQLIKMPSGQEWFIQAAEFLRLLGETEENIKKRLAHHR